MFEIYFMIAIFLAIQNLSGIILKRWVNIFVITCLLTIQSYTFLNDIFVEPTNLQIFGVTFIMAIPVAPMIWFFVTR